MNKKTELKIKNLELEKRDVAAERGMLRAGLVAFGGTRDSREFKMKRFESLTVRDIHIEQELYELKNQKSWWQKLLGL